MNFSLPDWNIGNETPGLMPQKNRPFGFNSDLLELCWENGHVVLNAQPQTHQHHHPPTDHLIQETETVSWIDDPCFDRDFFTEFPLDEEAHRSSDMASINPPPRFDAFDHHSHKDVVPVHEPVVNKQADHNCFRSSNKGAGNIRTMETVASSHCGSNQVVLDPVDGSPVSSSGIALAKTKHGNDVGRVSAKIQTLITSSSSGGSQSSFGRTTSNSHKRKTRDVAEDSECQSEDAELESAPRKKAGMKPRKSRAAEVHNLSERRRRDRINEKMRILQELLPHSNKTDKASMLDEAIEYMKALQQQLQMMWMGSGMAAAPFMFPGMQHYMSRLAGMGMLPPPHQNPMQFARLPLQPQQQQATRMPNAANGMFQQQNQMQNPQQFANYMQFHAMQRASQVNGFGPKTGGNSNMLAPPGNNQ